MRSATGRDGTRRLGGARVLVAEDEILIALDLAALLTDAGAAVVGPALSLDEGLLLADREELSAAVLDIRLGAQTTEPIAHLLDARHVPFLFYSGEAPTDTMRAAWPGRPVLSKPMAPGRLVDAVTVLLPGSRGDGVRDGTGARTAGRLLVPSFERPAG